MQWMGILNGFSSLVFFLSRWRLLIHDEKKTRSLNLVGKETEAIMTSCERVFSLTSFVMETRVRLHRSQKMLEAGT